MPDEPKSVEPTQKFKDLDYLISRIGMPAVMCGLLMWFMWAKFEKFEDKITWKLERIVRNQRAIMQKLEIPVILDGDTQGTPK